MAAGINYLQSVTPRLALGGEAFWLGQQRKSGAGFAGRFTGEEFVATAQLATTGLVSFTYVQRISEKVGYRPCSFAAGRSVVSLLHPCERCVLQADLVARAVPECSRMSHVVASARVVLATTQTAVS